MLDMKTEKEWVDFKKEREISQLFQERIAYKFSLCAILIHDITTAYNQSINKPWLFILRLSTDERDFDHYRFLRENIFLTI